MAMIHISLSLLMHLLRHIMNTFLLMGMCWSSFMSILSLDLMSTGLLMPNFLLGLHCLLVSSL